MPFSVGSLKIISEGTIKFTHPSEFNDPFDCRPYLDPETIRKLPKARPDLFKKLNQDLGLSPAQGIQQRGKFLARLRQRVETGDFSKDVTNIGIACLSAKPLNILMWSHYAQSHQGFVVEFKIPRSSRDPNTIASISTDLNSYLIPHEVEYLPTRPKHDFGSTTSLDYLLTKSEDWKYEAEHRVFARRAGIHLYKRDEILASVIAGMRMSEPNFATLKEIVGCAAKHSHLDLNLFKAEEIEDKYRLVVPGHPRLSSSAANQA